LIALLVLRSSELTGVDSTVVRFRPKGKNLSFGEQPGIAIGRVEPLFGSSTRALSINELGQIDLDSSIQEVQALWAQIGSARYRVRMASGLHQPRRILRHSPRSLLDQ